MPLYAKIIIVGFILIGSVAVIVKGSLPAQPTLANSGLHRQIPTTQDTSQFCIRRYLGGIKQRYFDCTDEATKEKVKIKPLIYVQEETIKAITTAYSPYETCTKERCINARGYRPIAGKSVACPRKYPLGTTVKIENHEYTCDDRLNKRFDNRFDLFMESYPKAKAYGKQEKEITITYEHPRIEEN